MNGRWIDATLGIVLMVLLAANLALGARDVTERNFEFLPTMVHSVPYNAYSANADLPSGMTMQEPPAGTIARGRMPLHFGPGPEEALRAGAELSSPLEAPDLERGRQLFEIYCQLCHGPEGRGNGTVAQRGFPAPPAFNSETTATLREGQIFHIVTFGQNNMPSHASQIDPAERWQIVEHVKELRSKLQEEPPAATVSPQAETAVQEPSAAEPGAVEPDAGAPDEGEVRS